MTKRAWIALAVNLTITPTVLYLVSAFAAWSWDPAQWDPEHRASVGVIYMIYLVFLLIVILPAAPEPRVRGGHQGSRAFEDLPPPPYGNVRPRTAPPPGGSPPMPDDIPIKPSKK